jgi:serine/threonine-protein kinase
MPLSIGQDLQGRYRLVRTLGQGGMAAVYLAEDLRLGRRCAVKESAPDPAASPQALAQLRQQFQMEARTLAGLDHPNLPRVSDYFSDAGNEYIVMEYVEGENLAEALTRHGGPLPEKPVLLWADQVLDALEYLHGRQPSPIIHRDIKPGNIILTPQGKVKLVDFGLVKLLDPNDPRTATVMKGMGTPEYAPLEQYASGAGHTDARSDIYALGATLHHLLTNAAPLDVHQRLLDPGKMPRPRQRNPALSAPTEAAVLRAMEVYPQARFQTAHELRAALAAARVALPSPAPPHAPATPTPTPAPRGPRGLTCPACGQANTVGEIYCQSCAASLTGERACSHCGARAPDAAIYCPTCGQAVTPVAAPCPQCGRASAPGEVYCQGCSRPLAGDIACRSCGHAMPQPARFCPECGK